MQIIYVCPNCGADLIDSVITTNPPRARKECSKCDWFWEEEPEDVVRVPFVPPEPKLPACADRSDYMFGWIPECCRNCSNHPSNGGSGICNCTLPHMTGNRTAPKGKTNVVTTYYTIHGKDDGTYTVSDHIGKDDTN